MFTFHLFCFCYSLFHLNFQALEEEIESHATEVHQAVKIGQSLSSLTCSAEQGVLSEKLDSLQARYCEIQDRCCRKAALLEQALSNARLFGEDEVEVLNWLAEVEDKLSSVFVKDYRQDVLQKQHADHLVFMFSILTGYVTKLFCNFDLCFFSLLFLFNFKHFNFIYKFIFIDLLLRTKLFFDESVGILVFNKLNQ